MAETSAGGWFTWAMTGSARRRPSAAARFTISRPSARSRPWLAIRSSACSTEAMRIIGCPFRCMSCRIAAQTRMTMGDKLTHIDADGRARMVDVSDKASTKRVATAEGRVLMSAKALDLARSKGGKGEGRATAELAGVLAAEETSGLIPRCRALA